MVLPLTLLGRSDSENVITTWAFWPNPVVPLLGVTEVTVGGVASAVLAVVKEFWRNGNAFPAWSKTWPLKLDCTRIRAFARSCARGVSVTTAPLTALLAA